MAGLLSRLFREPRCIIPDEDMEKIVQQEIAEHYPEVQNYLLKSTNKSKEAAYCAWPPLEFGKCMNMQVVHMRSFLYFCLMFLSKLNIF